MWRAEQVELLASSMYPPRSPPLAGCPFAGIVNWSDTAKISRLGLSF